MSHTNQSPVGVRSILDIQSWMNDLGTLIPPIFAGPEAPRPYAFVWLIFLEPSTRTLKSFEIAAQSLNTIWANLSPDTSSICKGETITDTIKTLTSYRRAPKDEASHLVVLRTSDEGLIYRLDQQFPEVMFVNAGNGALGEHPTQALGDCYTLYQEWSEDRPTEDPITLSEVQKCFQGKVVTILGDVKRSRVARSNAYLLQGLGATVRLAGPEAFMPEPGDEAFSGVERIESLAEALHRTDAVMTLRVQKERFSGGLLEAEEAMRAYSRDWCLTEEAIKGSDVKVLHPGPLNRGVEISSGVADGPHSLIWKQVQSCMWIRRAILMSTWGPNEA